MPAVPICLFLYPYHLKIVIDNLRARKFYFPFDKVNTKKLENYLNNNFNNESRERNLILLAFYENLYKNYLESRIGILTRIRKPGLSRKVKEKTVSYWHDCGRISDKSAKLLQKYQLLFLLFAFFGLIPFLGKFIRKAFLNPFFFKEFYRLIFPLFGNLYRKKKRESFRYRYTKKISN